MLGAPGPSSQVTVVCCGAVARCSSSSRPGPRSATLAPATATNAVVPSLTTTSLPVFSSARPKRKPATQPYGAGSANVPAAVPSVRASAPPMPKNTTSPSGAHGCGVETPAAPAATSSRVPAAVPSVHQRLSPPAAPVVK
jgi:hypothetical protein